MMMPQRFHRALLLLGLAITVSGCSREKYRKQTDRDVYNTIAESTIDPSLAVPNFTIEQDPRSRYYVPENVDQPPMPEDDPLAHRYMKSVWGRKGYKHWLDNGVTTQFENPE